MFSLFRGAAFGFLLCASGLSAQTALLSAPGARLQVGLGVLPGIGVQGVFIGQHNIYTREVALYADVTPPFAGGEGSVEVASAVGGAIRIIGIMRTIGNAGSRHYDLDIGLRLGPGLSFAFNETRKTKNQRFSLSQDPFIRFISTFGKDHVFYIELGAQRSSLRMGLRFAL